MIELQAKAVFTVTNPEQKPFNLTLAGRNLWAMQQLMRAGNIGCTPIDKPGPRWSAYIHNLRKMDVLIETINEAHGGIFKGTHARYVLRSKVTSVWKGGAE